MSKTTLKTLAGLCREATAAVAWAQWAAVGSIAASARPARSLIDPEALVLVSLSLLEHERRLADALAEWAPVGARLLSVQRIKNLARTLPQATRDRLEAFAFLAHTEAADPRWKSMYDPDLVDGSAIGRNRGAGRLHLESDAALLLRLRLGFGVNLKTDVLAFLIGTCGASSSVAEMAGELCFTKAATRRAAEDLLEARLIDARPGSKPREYMTPAGSWDGVLRPAGAAPRRVAWHRVFEFMARLDDWDRNARGRKLSPFALNALGNELAEGYEAELDLPRITGGWAQTSPPESFEQRVRSLCSWMVEQA